MKDINAKTKLEFMGDEEKAISKLAKDVLEFSEEYFRKGRKPREYGFPEGVAVVPIRNTNAHNYPLGAAYIRRNENSSYKHKSGIEDEGRRFYLNSDGPIFEAGAASWSGDEGNNMTINTKALRCPTLEELETYLYDLYFNRTSFFKEIISMERYK